MNLLSYSCVGQKSDKGLSRLKSKCGQPVFLLEALWEDPFPCLIFPGSTGLFILAHSLLHVRTSNGMSNPSSRFSGSLQSGKIAPWRTLVITLGHPDNPECSPKLKVLDLSHICKVPLPRKVTHLQVLGIRMWTSLEGSVIILPTLVLEIGAV